MCSDMSFETAGDSLAVWTKTWRGEDNVSFLDPIFYLASLYEGVCKKAKALYGAP